MSTAAQCLMYYVLGDWVLTFWRSCFGEMCGIASLPVPSSAS